MSICPPRTDEGKRCFTFCGEDRCDCGAVTAFIVSDISARFGEELARLMRPPERPSAEDLAKPRFFPSRIGRTE